MPHRHIAVAAVLLALVASPGVARQGRETRVSSDKREAVLAPEFPEGLEWLNTDRPLSLRELRGKVVLLDFWTYCCINCMHILPDLARLEAKYANELVVIGVHSAKFTTERETESIRQAVLRYEIHHPVVNDRDFRIWRAYGARAWPTLILIAPDGTVVGGSSGEGVFGPYDRAIQDVIQRAEAAGTLDRRPRRFRSGRQTAPEPLLSFPGKVLSDAASNRLFIADTNHNRVVVASLADGTVLDTIGSGERGLGDGAFERARFAHPQGLALDGNILFVADTENHSVRRVDLERRVVSTLVGTGVQAAARAEGGIGMSASLNSPWDLALRGGTLFVAMAGSHQVWSIDLATLRAKPFTGSGAEDRIDGPAATAALAQPSGLALDGDRLFVADSEVSSIRAVSLDDGAVSTVVGLGLFEFGDNDGPRRQVRLQHPLGVAVARGALLVADTYNHKIKRIDPGSGQTQTLAGNGAARNADGKARDASFNEPGGLSVAGGRLYVADTNNHAVRVVDLETGTVATFALRGLGRLPAPSTGRFEGEIVELAERAIAPGRVVIRLDAALPPGFELTKSAPLFAGVSSSEARSVAVAAGSTGRTYEDPRLPLELAVEAREGRATLDVDVVLYFCRGGDAGRCYVTMARLRLPVRVVPDGATELGVSVPVAAP